jgi:hypothetical protein
MHSRCLFLTNNFSNSRIVSAPAQKLSPAASVKRINHKSVLDIVPVDLSLTKLFGPNMVTMTMINTSKIP